jgi:hypothetical protein
MIYIGIDPGADGAIALFAPGKKASRGAPAIAATLSVWDLPTNKVMVGATARKRLDVVGFSELLDDIFLIEDPDRIVIEQVNAMPKQSGMFAFGYGVGLLHATMKLRKLTFEEVPASKWKRELKAPKDKAHAIARAEEIFPEHRHLWRYKATNGKDATRPDRAEAALLAYYAATC